MSIDSLHRESPSARSDQQPSPSLVDRSLTRGQFLAVCAGAIGAFLGLNEVKENHKLDDWAKAGYPLSSDSLYKDSEACLKFCLEKAKNGSDDPRCFDVGMSIAVINHDLSAFKTFAILAQKNFIHDSKSLAHISCDALGRGFFIERRDPLRDVGDPRAVDMKSDIAGGIAYGLKTLEILGETLARDDIDSEERAQAEQGVVNLVGRGRAHLQPEDLEPLLAFARTIQLTPPLADMVSIGNR